VLEAIEEDCDISSMIQKRIYSVMNVGYNMKVELEEANEL
jgi:hypothetical protein